MRIPSGRPSPNQIGFVLGETLLMLGGTLLAVYLRVLNPAELFSWQYSWHRIFLVPVVIQATFYYFDLYNFRTARTFIWEMTRVAQAMALGTMVLAVIYYMLPRLFLGRGVLTLNFFLLAGLVLVWRGLYWFALKRRLFSTRIIILASGSLADAIFEELVSRSDNLYNVVCVVDGAPPQNDGEAHHNLMEAWARLMRTELWTDPSELVGLVRYFKANMVVVAMDEKRGCMPLEQLLRCRMLGVPVVAGEDFFEAAAGRILANRIRTSWLIFSPGFHTGHLRSLTKRMFDIGLSLLGLLLSSPLALLTALAVLVDSRGPVIYRQERVGFQGKPFTIFKFRTMVANAEQETGPVWAAEGDARVTRVGRFLRVSRLDEIPQLWNILKGDMSFVGPRPERPHFVNSLKAKLPYYAERHNVKPGLTGWAQVCYPYGASEGAALEKLNYDLYYIKHSSMGMDIIIMVQTLKIMLLGGGGR